jgi:uncharacterized protein
MDIRAITFQMTKACNLACSYCYVQQDGRLSGKCITWEVIEKALCTLFSCKDDLSHTVTFFGGEPLLQFNLMRKTIEYTKQCCKKPRFSVTTNGTLLSPGVCEYLVENDVNLIVSYDGPCSIHDHYRKDMFGNGSHVKVMRGLYNMRDAYSHQGKANRIALRGTFGPEFAQLVTRVNDMHNLLDKNLCASITIEPYEFVSDTMYGISLSDEALLREEYTQVTDFLIKRIVLNKKASFNQIMLYVKRLLSPTLHFTECGAGCGFVSVGTDGVIYPCHREGTPIGHIDSGFCSERDVWEATHKADNPDCHSCDLFGICGGPCRQQSLITHGVITKPEPVSCMLKRICIDQARRIIETTGGSYEEYCKHFAKDTGSSMYSGSECC